MKRILFMSDGIWTPTGFGVVLHNIVPRIAKMEDEFKTGFVSWQHEGNIVEFNNMLMYPINRHRFGADSLYQAISHFKPDVLVTLGDYWMLNYLATEYWQKKLKEKNIKWIWYTPVDSDEIGYGFEESIKKADVCVSMSRWGEKVLNEYNIDNVYISHGVDTDIFKPLDNKIELKKREGYEDKFVVGCVARNQWRKQLDRLLDAFKMFSEDKNDVILRFHCDPYDPADMIKDFAGNKYYRLLYRMKKLKLGDKTQFTSLASFSCGVSFQTLCEIYNLFDIHALPTSGEGFGLPIIESMACGIPNLMTNFTTCEELIMGRGEAVKVKDIVRGDYGTNRAMIDREDLVAKLNKLYYDRALLNDYSTKCAKFAIEYYDWNRCIIPKWVDLFRSM